MQSSLGIDILYLQNESSLSSKRIVFITKETEYRHELFT
jgi:hypothetical protein